MNRICKKHGEHSDWRVRKPPSNIKKGKGFRYECRKCLREGKAKGRRSANYKEIAAVAGAEAAAHYLKTKGAKKSNYVFQARGIKLPASMFEGTVKSTRSKLARLGKERLLSFLNTPTCEKCGIVRANRQFFEVHHIKPRSEGGTDDSANLIILCPNCHRDQHFN